MNTKQISNHFNLKCFWLRKCDLLCYHGNGNIFTREDITQIKSHVNHGKREFVPRDQVSPFIVLYFSLLLPH